jgi:hypothetical protein
VLDINTFEEVAKIQHRKEEISDMRFSPNVSAVWLSNDEIYKDCLPDVLFIQNRRTSTLLWVRTTALLISTTSVPTSELALAQGHPGLDGCVCLKSIVLFVFMKYLTLRCLHSVISPTSIGMWTASYCWSILVQRRFCFMKRLAESDRHCPKKFLLRYIPHICHIHLMR